MSVIDEGDAARDPAYIAVMLSVCGLAVILNILVIIVLVHYGRCRSSVDIFLTNLAVSDIIMAGVVLPIHFKIITRPGDDFQGGNIICKIEMFVPLVIIMTSIATIVAIAADRYRAILYEKKLVRSGALTVVGVIWAVSLAVSAPQLYEYRIYEEFEEETNHTYNSCGAEGIGAKFQTVYASIVFVVAYVIPLVTLTICYTKLSLFLWKHAKRFRRTNILTGSNAGKIRPAHSVVTSRNIRVFKMLLSITVTFAVLWTPYFILFARMEIRNRDHAEHFAGWPNLVSRTMTVLSTITNPIIYLLLGRQFRMALRKTIVCLCPTRHKDYGYAITASMKAMLALSAAQAGKKIEPRSEPIPCISYI